jgi:ATP-dependent exoDNAse (exonuclease V) beta subunit
VPILEKDVTLNFPHFTLLKASAGSGKTYALTERFVQFLLSDKIPGNRLGNILAITFSNNASKEMKERVLEWLKLIHFDHPERVSGLLKIVSLDRETMIKKAGQVVDEILAHYSDFQVRTIDSFMSTVFKASAIDFGYTSDFEILMNPDPLTEYAFGLFLRNVKEGTGEAALLDDIVKIILEHKRDEAAYLWDPSAALLVEVKKICRKMASLEVLPRIQMDPTEMQQIKRDIRSRLERLEERIATSGLERSETSSFPDLLSLVREGRFAGLIGRGLKSNPVRKPKKSEPGVRDAYERIVAEWTEAGNLIRAFASCYARSFYSPYLLFHQSFNSTVEWVKKHQGRISIEDINRKLAEYLRADIVPDIYFRIGESVLHYLIDEFQDSSPIQWQNLFPLIDNSLAQGGSLFVVGDTKQAIYGFRDADYTIMKSFETKNPFPSSKQDVLELDTNYRSLPRILEFSAKVFKEVGPSLDHYAEGMKRSGLSQYIQNPRKGEVRPGYVEVEILDRDDESPPERKKVQDLLEQLKARGYWYRDIAVLTTRNERVVQVTSWLNEKNIPFISYSSLDIRRRKVTGEVISLLRFLDSPPDDLSFAAFILGDIFAGAMTSSDPEFGEKAIRRFLFRNREKAPLYKAFQKEFAELWERYFSGLFRSAGYLPLYDLVTEIFRVFRVFERMQGEEAVLSKILEAIKDFEAKGYNSLRDFLGSAAEEETPGKEWNIDVPKGLDAVRAMTLHKAKGLGFPVVIVLLYGERNRGFDYVVHREGGEACLLKLNKDIAACDPLLETLYREEGIQEQVDRLNGLYVEFTRAKEELYVIGVKGQRDRFPFDLLPAGDYPPSDNLPRITREEEKGTEAFPLFHHAGRAQFPASAAERFTLEDRQRGEFIHRVLCLINDLAEGLEESLSRAIQQVRAEMRIDFPDRAVVDPLIRMLRSEEMANYFTRAPGREFRKEQECSDSDGRLFRMDRIVVEEDRVTVLDYKTGSERDAAKRDEAQVRNYMRLLKEVYPGRSIQGVICYLDLGEVTKIT